MGSFDGDVGIFEGPDTFEGRPILVRYTWSGVTTAMPRWEQAFSDDDGETWETNFVTEFTRAEAEMSSVLEQTGTRPVRLHACTEGRPARGRCSSWTRGS